MMNKGTEYILTAANHYQDGKVHSSQPKNINTGLVLCGRRHHNIIYNYCKLTGASFGDDCESGFITSFDRFVNRNEAAQIARDAGQVNWTDVDWDVVELHSEDLY